MSTSTSQPQREPDLAGVHISERVIPVPRSVSPQAQAMLCAPVFIVPPDLPPLHDKAGWRALVKKTDDHLPLICQRVAGIDATTQTVEMGGVAVYVTTLAGLPAENKRYAYLDIHGGAHAMGGGEFCRLMSRYSAAQAGVPTYSVDYRTAPDHPYPSALDDCLAVYRALLGTHASREIIVGGISAGGNLAAALVLRARDEGLPLPAGLVLLTPELDLTESGDSFQTHRDIDVVLKGPLPEFVRLYAGDHDLSHPYLSPLFGDFTRGFPPTFLQAGTRDLFLSNTVRMHRALRRAGVPVELHVFEAMPHGGFGGAPEDEELSAEMRRFVQERLRS